MRILLADDHDEFLREFIAFLAPRHDVIGAACDGEELVRLAFSRRPDIVLADIGMPRMNGVIALQKIFKQPVPPKSIFVTMHSSVQYVKHALRIGACGFVLKEHAFEQIEDAIQTVLAGQIYLSPQLDFPHLTGE
jgi:DNA-binding NarL/FixJ family response regulator